MYTSMMTAPVHNRGLNIFYYAQNFTWSYLIGSLWKGYIDFGTGFSQIVPKVELYTYMCLN
jgi:hypothetical protein